MPKKHTVDELTRLAFHYAIEDRMAFADAISGCGPDYDELKAETATMLAEFKAYMIKRGWLSAAEHKTEDS